MYKLLARDGSLIKIFRTEKHATSFIIKWPLKGYSVKKLTKFETMRFYRCGII
jgi:hypothetical protein